jgi:tetratricopeptide (TPR) repeat protein
MSYHAIRVLTLAALLALAGPALHAGEPQTLPPAAGLSESAANNEPDARAIEDRIWTFWRSFADAESQRLLDASKQAQLRFDYGNAIAAMQDLVKHAPRFAEAWNQLAYVLFLAGGDEASLQALDRTLELEPMHYAALAGKGIILTQQGKDDLAKIALKKALAINPWLKERNLIVKDTDRKN